MKTATYQTTSEDPRIATLTEEVESLREQLCRAHQLAALTTATAMVAHELNNILTPVQSYIQLAQDDGDEDLRDKAVIKAAEGLARATAVSQALLDVVGPRGRIPRKVLLSELVAGTLTAMGRDLAKDGINLVTNIKSGLKFTTRPGELQQVLLNLLANAVKFTTNGTVTAHIGTELTASGRATLAIAVKDSGIGITPEDQSRIFDDFVTLDPTYERNANGTGGNGGSGLGLAVCRRIVAGLNGRMTVRSELGKGACFSIILPIDGQVPKPSRKA
ncbi:hypothetical protein LCGC14_1580130 [marine sediment metagenome]|uniref:histidine kinase n=1 Tax=marine sediment metagenome TaxID=412755 RepID=A0A0F9J383_9ZZZZ